MAAIGPCGGHCSKGINYPNLDDHWGCEHNPSTKKKKKAIKFKPLTKSEATELRKNLSKLCEKPKDPPKRYTILELIRHCGKFTTGRGFKFIIANDENGKDLLGKE